MKWVKWSEERFLHQSLENLLLPAKRSKWSTHYGYPIGFHKCKKHTYCTPQLRRIRFPFAHNRNKRFTILHPGIAYVYIRFQTDNSHSAVAQVWSSEQNISPAKIPACKIGSFLRSIAQSTLHSQIVSDRLVFRGENYSGAVPSLSYYLDILI